MAQRRRRGQQLQRVTLHKPKRRLTGGVGKYRRLGKLQYYPNPPPLVKKRRRQPTKTSRKVKSHGKRRRVRRS